MDQNENCPVKDALKAVVERKLMGTWKLAVLPLADPSTLYFVKNSGDFILAQTPTSLLVTSADSLLSELGIKGW